MSHFKEHRGVYIALLIIAVMFVYAGCASMTKDPSTGEKTDRAGLAGSFDVWKQGYEAEGNRMVLAYDRAIADLDRQDEMKATILSIGGALAESFAPQLSGIIGLGGLLLAGGAGLDRRRTKKDVTNIVKAIGAGGGVAKPTEVATAMDALDTGLRGRVLDIRNKVATEKPATT